MPGTCSNKREGTGRNEGAPGEESLGERAVKGPTATYAFAAFFVAILLLILGAGMYRLSSPEAAPDQPIAFPHTIHAGTLALPCEFCHLFVDRSRHAGVPPVETCMSCHSSVATEREEIRKLARYYREETPIEWNRVHSLPDFIYFSHKRHVKAGVDCAECHGDVKGMPKIRRVSSLTMGWCVSCHKIRGASRDCATCHK